jgi:hypothetical protein
MFYLLLFSALCCSFLQAADHVLAPFKNPTFDQDTRKELVAGFLCGSVAASVGMYAGAQLDPVLIPVACMLGVLGGGLSGHGLQDKVRRFHDYEGVGEDIAQKYAGNQIATADTKSFSNSYKRLRIGLAKKVGIEKEEKECDNMLKKIVSKRSTSALQQNPKIRDEHNRLCDDWQRQYKWLRFVNGFMVGTMVGPIGLLLFAKKMGILAS